MTNQMRVRAYYKQNGGRVLTRTQIRRIQKKSRARHSSSIRLIPSRSKRPSGRPPVKRVLMRPRKDQRRSH